MTHSIAFITVVYTAFALVTSGCTQAPDASRLGKVETMPQDRYDETWRRREVPGGWVYYEIGIGASCFVPRPATSCLCLPPEAPR